MRTVDPPRAGSRSPTTRRASTRFSELHDRKDAMRRVLPILGLWCALSIGLAAVTTRVADWFAMPNELLYERRAISVAQSLSVLPRVRGELVSTFDQLYPVLVAPAFRWGDMQDSLWAAHALNAWIMASACIPAFLLARRVTAVRWIPYVVAVLAVVMPWILLASFLLTEVAAYPAFVWAVFAMQASVAAPSRRHDLLALAALAVAFVGRTQLALLFLVLPVVILAFELGRSGGVRTARASRRRPPSPAGLGLRRARRGRHRPRGRREAAEHARRLRSDDRRHRCVGERDRRAERHRRLARRARRDVLARARHPAVRRRHGLAAREPRTAAGRPRAARFRVHRRAHRHRALRPGDHLRPALRRPVRPRPLPLLRRAAARAGVPPGSRGSPLAPLVARRADRARGARLRLRRTSRVHVGAVRPGELGRADLGALPTARRRGGRPDLGARRARARDRRAQRPLRGRRCPALTPRPRHALGGLPARRHASDHVVHVRPSARPRRMVVPTDHHVARAGLRLGRHASSATRTSRSRRIPSRPRSS